MRSRSIHINENLELCVFAHEDDSCSLRITSLCTDYRIEVSLNDVRNLGYSIIKAYESLKYYEDPQDAA